MVGKTLGHYEILEPLGAGGMGEVYRARDTNLDRDIVIKVLPENFAEDAERLARFEREAKLLASLNHSNIATIHGLEDSDGVRFIAMELVEGDTLADRLAASGRIDVEEALEIARQIAEALEAAHDSGVIHRDLKPANVKITPGGKVKVLDFGLAKAWAPEFSESDLTRSPTITVEGTATGVIMGTAAYMSPEQAKGKSLDKRTDIFSFGCVVYEMLTGRKAFVGEDVSDTLAAILRDEPDWNLLPPGTPPIARSLLRRCLRKDPDRRLHDIADARIEIEDAFEETADVEAAALAVRKARLSLRWALPMLVMASILGAVVDRLALRGSRDVTPVVPTRLLLELEPGYRLWGGVRMENAYWTLQRPSRTAMALSPDGTNLVYSATNGETSRLFLRSLGRSRAIPIAGTDGGFSPFFAPDGTRIGFFVHAGQSSGQWDLKLVPTDGGEPRTITTLSGLPMGSSWGSDGTIVLARYPGDLLRVPAGGGEPNPLTEKSEEFYCRLPVMVPGRRAVIYTAQRGFYPLGAEIVVQSLDNPGERKVLITEGTDARLVPTGHLLFMRRGDLMAVPFDSQRLEVAGEPLVVVDGVMHAMFALSEPLDSGAGQFALSDSGTLVFATGDVHPEFPASLAWVDRQGESERLPLPPLSYVYPVVSPDGRKLAYAVGRPGELKIWVYDIELGIRRQLTFDGNDQFPVWSPDGSRILFSSDGGTGGHPSLHLIPADGSGEPQRLLPKGNVRQAAASWSPQDVIAYVENDDIWVMQLDDMKPQPLLATPSVVERYPVFSPDGKWLAYASEKTGQPEVYVRPYPGPGAEHKVSIDRGQGPAWSRDGSELYYRMGQAQIWVARITPAETFLFETPRLLFEGEFDATFPVKSYDVLADGRFVMMPSEHDVEQQPVTKLHVVLNWFEELKQRVPVER